MIEREDRTLAADLLVAIPHLPERDRSFANSLINGFNKWQSFTDKQRPYVIKMIEKVNAPAPVQTKVEIGSLEGIFTLFQRVRGRLKDPSIMLQTNDGTPVSVAFYKGGLKVTNGESWNSGRSRWYGAIDAKGVWTPHKSCTAVFVATVLEILTAFAANPAEVAAEYGILTGRCCFCHGKKMTAPASKAVGYGPVCAKNYGLPWGKNKANPLTQFVAEEVA